MYYPPRPRSLPAVAALVRAVARGDGDLLSLLPAKAYRMPIGALGYSRRSIILINAPDLVRQIMTEKLDIYPKSDLMVDALEPLIGDSIFVSQGKTWRRQRLMVDPAFSLMRVNRGFDAMRAAVDDFEVVLDQRVEDGESVSLDMAMSHLTADIITRTVFSQPLKSDTSRDVFDAFTVFERSVAQVEIRRLIMDKAWTKSPQRDEVLEACRKIRQCLGRLLTEHQRAGGGSKDDIAGSFAAARDPETGEGFTRDELIDQLGVMFLAGHETTASVLTWVFFILATQPDEMRRVREEIDSVVGDGKVTFENTKGLTHIRNVFRETLRLYPPITFIPRVAAETTRLGGRRIKKGAMIIIAPWALHRNARYWTDPDAFDPDRFSPGREAEHPPGAYIPFGQGPRTCVGAAFATIEACLIIARLARRYDFQIPAPEKVRPVARLTTRPKHQIWMKVKHSD